MLAVSPLRSSKNEKESEMEGFSAEENGFIDFSGGNLLDSIDFDDLFMAINDGDLLPDLEMDMEILAEFSVSGGEESERNCTTPLSVLVSINNDDSGKDEKASVSVSASVSASDLGSRSSSLINQGEEIVSKRDGDAAVNPSIEESHDNKGRKSSAHSKNPLGKRKMKVDWTPELHRRFVLAVEQLGVDKAVPSRILELMGINCLTRHNIASHLQKYRSHRKHLLAREVEAANWSQRRQVFGSGSGTGKRDITPWIAPTMGFPPHVSPMPPIPHFRSLHVWGHPSVDQSFMHTWPKHLAPLPPPPPHACPPPPHPLLPPPSADPSFWHSHHHHHVPTPGTPCFPPHLLPTRFPTASVQGIPQPPAMYPTAPSGQSLPQPPSDFHPSKESIDAVIGDVLSKPWLPLPLGLKPPSTDSVMSELQLQGISKIPPTCSN